MEEEILLDIILPTRSPDCSVLVATYNRPAFLKLLLLGLLVQTKKTFEVVICDDGSTPDTFDMLKSIAPVLDFGIRYVWQEDREFRKARILNRGILACRSDYLIFIDDDCIPHRRYVEGHLRRKRFNSLVFGKYVTVEPKQAASITPEGVIRGELESPPFLTLKKRVKLLMSWLRFYKHLLEGRPMRPKLLGANFAVDKTSLYRVNGFNEAFEGWGYEDNELRMRLVNSGVKMREAIRDAIVFHIDEEIRRNEQYTTGRDNKGLFLQWKDRTWAELGLRRSGR